MLIKRTIIAGYVFLHQNHHLPPPTKQPETMIGAAKQRLNMRQKSLAYRLEDQP
jgi:hypothetical protein|eukprot:GDKH01016050.1.p1 GENE.GDKH01016050.1~~GDKH01016050.1.p1  ORF type:complete len:54 (-),score=1.81 GDKH01016050.1:116-277(-)